MWLIMDNTEWLYLSTNLYVSTVAHMVMSVLTNVFAN